MVLVLPLIGLASSTVGVVWYSFAKAQLVQMAAEGAMQAAQPDTSEGEVLEALGTKLRSRLGIDSFSAATATRDGITSVSLEVPPVNFLGPLSLIFPGLSVVSYAPNER